MPRHRHHLYLYPTRGLLIRVTNLNSAFWRKIWSRNCELVSEFFPSFVFSGPSWLIRAVSKVGLTHYRHQNSLSLLDGLSSFPKWILRSFVSDKSFSDL